MPKFEREVIGSVLYGPSHRIQCCVVHYRNHKNQLKWYGDLRFYTYSVKKVKFYASPKGITFTQEISKGLVNVVNALPDEMPILKEGEQTIIEKFQRYPTLWVAIGLVNIAGETKIDIREWIKVDNRGYEGFTTKGIRFSYDRRFELSTMLMGAFNKMYDMEQKMKGLDKDD